MTPKKRARTGEIPSLMGEEPGQSDVFLGSIGETTLPEAEVVKEIPEPSPPKPRRRDEGVETEKYRTTYEVPEGAYHRIAGEVMATRRSVGEILQDLAVNHLDEIAENDPILQQYRTALNTEKHRRVAVYMDLLTHDLLEAKALELGASISALVYVLAIKYLKFRGTFKRLPRGRKKRV